MYDNVILKKGKDVSSVHIILSAPLYKKQNLLQYNF